MHSSVFVEKAHATPASLHAFLQASSVAQEWNILMPLPAIKVVL
jgi:hypothetical protein